MVDFVENTLDRDTCRRPYDAKTSTFVYGKGEPRDATDSELKSLNLCFDYLLKHNMLKNVETNEFQKYFSNEMEDENEDETEI